MRKGQAEVIENVFTIFFGIILLTAISVIAYNLYTNQLKTEIENNLKQLALEISNNILKLYESGKNSKYSPMPNEIAKLAEINLNLPPRISGRNYEIFLISSSPIWIQISSLTIGGISPATQIITSPGAKIILRTTQFPEVVVEQEVPNIDVLVQGKIENGLNSTLLYYRSNLDNRIKDFITLGEQEIIVDILRVG
ncbi:MAG: hypothetical protein QW040_01390 [Candidatus Aenigmatarchaeota archaeon]